MYIIHSILISSHVLLIFLNQKYTCGDALWNIPAIRYVQASMRAPLTFGTIYITTRIGFYKVQFYGNLGDTTPTSKCFRTFAKYAMYLWGRILPISTIVISWINIHPRMHDNGSSITWYKSSTSMNALCMIVIVPFFWLNIFILFELWLVGNSKDIVIYEWLRDQIKLHAYFMTPVFITSTLFYTSWTVIFAISPKHSPIVYHFLWCDMLLNNVLIFFLVYSNSKWRDMPISRMPPRLRWVLFPGFYPIQVSEQEIREHGLEEYVVRRKEAIEIQRSNDESLNHCSIASFRWLCCAVSPDTLHDRIDFTLHE